MAIHVLTGRSGIGKSAFLIRPLRWLVMNKPVGESFRKWGSKETRVTIDLDGNTGWITRLKVQNFQCHENVEAVLEKDTGPITTISRFRSNKENGYEVCRPDGTHDIIRIGSDKKVPEVIANILQLGDINFQFQHDPIYMLAMNHTPFNLARMLNDMVGMGEIDDIVARINLRHDRESKEVIRLSKEEKGLEEKLLQYSGLEEMAESISSISTMKTKVESIKTEKDGITNVINTIDIAIEELVSYILVDEVCEKYDMASTLVSSREATHIELVALVAAVERVSKAEEELLLYKELDEFPTIPAPVDTSILDTINQIRGLCFRYSTNKNQRDSTSIEIEKVDAKFSELMPNMCPLCGTVLGDVM